MKKVLIGLLVLAVAGGSAFAQGWTFSGLTSGGLGLFVLEDGERGADASPTSTTQFQTNDDPFLRVSSLEAMPGIRTQLVANFANEDRTAGLSFQIRHDHNATGPAARDAFFNFGFGWLSFMDNMVTVYGGLVDHGYFNSLDRISASDMGEGLGLSFVIRPMENLMFNLAAYANAGQNMLMADREGTPFNLNQAKGVVAVSYTEPDLFRVTAGFRNTSEVNTGWGNWWGGSGLLYGTGATALDLNNLTRPHDRGSGRTSAAYLSFAYLALDDIHIAATAAFQNLEEFGDYGDMRFYVTFAHTGLVENMGLHLGASLGINNSERFDLDRYGSRQANTAGTGFRMEDRDMHVWIWAAVDYQLTDTIVPRLDLHWVTGGSTDWQHFHRHEGIRNNVTFHEDHSFFQIRPSVQFRVTPSAFLELGCIFHIDLGDLRTFGNAPAYLGGYGDHALNARQAAEWNNGMNIAAYLMLRVAF